uniref:Putative conserved secreted protein n=1 Tax=Phlebotomus kandelakii TaxID=1109342 RepID=A0A6B2E6H8_9DIPT
MTKGYILFLLLFASVYSTTKAHKIDYSREYSEYVEKIDESANDYVSNEDVELIRPQKVNHGSISRNDENDNQDTDMVQNPPSQVHCIHRDRGRVCDCGFQNEEAILPRMMGSIAHVTVSNCKFIRILNGTFDTLNMLNEVTFINIEHLVLDENSLSFPRPSMQLRVSLLFRNVVIEQIPSHAINGFITSIFFDRCRIGLINSFAVTAIRLRLEAFAIWNTFISRIEHQAFKKFSCDTFNIMNSTVNGQISSRSFYDLDVTSSLMISDSDFLSRIHSRAFDFQVVNMASIFRNNFSGLSGESFVMSVQSMPVITENNMTFIEPRAFASVVIEREVLRRITEPMYLDFSRNNFDTPGDPEPLQFSPEFRLVFTTNRFITPITCEQISRIQHNEFFHQFSSEIFFRHNDYIIDKNQDFSSNQDEFHSFAYIIENFCIETSHFWYIILGVGLFVLLLLIILIIILCVWWRRRKARQLEIVKPEGKTYRETQIVMQIENHGLLKTEL